MKTEFVKNEDINNGNHPRKWWVIDVEGQPLGRVATQIATLLRGKHKPTYTAHVDTGDFVVVVNADKVKLTGNKLRQKMYYRHTGYPGGLKQARAFEMLEKKPESLVYMAVKRMMPKNALNRKSLHKLKIYADTEHPHSAQKPETFSI